MVERSPAGRSGRWGRELAVLATLGAAVLSPVVLVVGLAGTVVTGCGSGCDPSSCKAGNECLSDGKTTECRLVCDSADGCPVNYACTRAAGAEKAFCAPAAAAVRVTAGSGVWGARCNASLGVENPECDDKQGFFCQASSPGDGNAYCTRFFCEGDAECAPGFYCATLNKAPNASDPTRSRGETWAVCVRRSYCAPCNDDLDCPKTAEGQKQYCVKDDAGGKLCAPPCDDDSNCPLDAECKGALELKGAGTCKPRAGACKGDGSFCSPCLSDADCPEGLCIEAGFSSERFCSVAATGGCAVGASACPKVPAPDTQLGCTQRDTPGGIPKDQCVGLVKVGSSVELGCWTRPR